MNGLEQDLRYALRQFGKNPGFAVAAVLTLALGIGANTAIFSMVNSVLLRPLPIRDPERVVDLSYEEKKMGTGNGFSVPDFEDIRQQSNSVFSGIVALRVFQMDGLAFNGRSDSIWTAYVSGDFFSMMGVKAALGRLIQPDEGAGANPVLVLSYAYWKTHFGGNREIVGTKVMLSGRPVTIVGVAEEGFRGPSALLDMQGYLPLGMCTFEGRKEAWTSRDARELLLLARLKDGISVAQAQPAMEVIGRRLAQEYPQYHEGMVLHAYQLQPMGPDSGPPDSTLSAIASVFLALAVAVLVLACLNVANLVLVRATVRQREIAMRAALGAGRARIVRQLLTESALLTALSCLIGLGLGILAARVLGSVSISSDLPIVLDFHFDWRVFLYGFGLSALSALVVGMVPALRASGAKLGDILHDSGRAVVQGRQRLRSALVVAQVAGSLMLLITAGLFVRSLMKVQSADLGFDPRHVMNFTMDPRELGYSDEAGKAFYQNLLEQARALPGVQSATLAATVPMGYYSFSLPVRIPGQESDSIGSNSVSAGYFETMRIPLLRGRDFSVADNETSQFVAVVNQAMAERYWPHEDLLGKQFTATINGKDRSLEIIGVVKNIRSSHPGEPAGPYFYTPLTQYYRSTQTLQVRSAGRPELSLREVLALVKSLAPSLPVFDVQTMSHALNTLNGLLLFQLGAGLAASMGVLGLTLAVVGMYGILSYATALRTHEIGIRMALGAQADAVVRMILRQGIVIVGMGLALGLLAGVAMGRLVANFLVDVPGTDPATFAVVALSLAGIALVACYLPARRAARVDPMVALRYE